MWEKSAALKIKFSSYILILPQKSLTWSLVVSLQKKKKKNKNVEQRNLIKPAWYLCLDLENVKSQCKVRLCMKENPFPEVIHTHVFILSNHLAY